MEYNSISYKDWIETSYGKGSVPIVKNLMDDGAIDGFIEHPTPIINGEEFVAECSKIDIATNGNEYEEILENIITSKGNSKLYLLSMMLLGGHYFFKTKVVDSETFSTVYLDEPKFEFVEPEMKVRYVLIPNN